MTTSSPRAHERAASAHVTAATAAVLLALACPLALACMLALPACKLLGLAPLPCAHDDGCAIDESCVEGHCAARLAGEGEGDAAEGEGDAAEGEGDAAEGEGDAAEGEGDPAEGEGDPAEGEGEGDVAPDFVVDDPGDLGDDVGGDGACATAGGGCTLRAAIEETVAGGVARVVGLGVSVTVTAGLDVPTGADVTIVGGGDASALSAAAGARLFHVTGRLALRELAVRDTSQSGDGGGVLVDGAGLLTAGDVLFDNNQITGSSDKTGAAVAVEDIAHGDFSRCRFTNNGVNDAATGGAAIGVRFAEASVSVDSCAFVGNHGGNAGGALYMNTPGENVVVTRSLFTNNSAVSYSGAIDFGCSGTGHLVVENDTFVDNTAGIGGGAIGDCNGAADAFVTLRYSTFVNNAPNTFELFANGRVQLEGCIVDVAGTGPFEGNTGVCETLGGNAVDGDTPDATCLFDDASDVVGTVAIGALADNGGFTQTVLPAAGSIAIDIVAGNALACPATDARGAPRPFGNGCDAGAVERGATVP